MKESKDVNILEQYIAVSARVCYTLVEGKVMLLEPKKNAFYTLNPVATRIWQLSDGSLTAGQIAGRISRQFRVSPAQAKSDAVKFIKELAGLDFLCISKKKK